MATRHQPRQKVHKMLKNHLQHTVNNGATCQRGRAGASLRGEHLTYKYSDFVATPVEHRCTRCNNSKLFAFLQRKAVAN